MAFLSSNTEGLQRCRGRHDRGPHLRDSFNVLHSGEKHPYSGLLPLPHHPQVSRDSWMVNLVTKTSNILQKHLQHFLRPSSDTNTLCQPTRQRARLNLAPAPVNLSACTWPVWGSEGTSVVAQQTPPTCPAASWALRCRSCTAPHTAQRPEVTHGESCTQAPSPAVASFSLG